jgi:predicted HicB family RNase H-like nuclease
MAFIDAFPDDDLFVKLMLEETKRQLKDLLMIEAEKHVDAAVENASSRLKIVVNQWVDAQFNKQQVHIETVYTKA